MANTLPRRLCCNERSRGCLVVRNHRRRIAHYILLYGCVLAHYFQANFSTACRYESTRGQFDFEAQDQAQVQELVGFRFRRQEVQPDQKHFYEYLQH